MWTFRICFQSIAPLVNWASMAAFRRSAHRRPVLFWGAAALAMCAFSPEGNMFVVPMVPFWRGQAAGHCSIGSLGRKASSVEPPYDEELHKDLIDVAAVWDMRVDFGKFADSLLPLPRFPVDDIQELIKGHAEKLFPNCKVSLVGSCNREVHNKFFSDLDFHISNTRGGPSPKEFQNFCNVLKHDPSIESVEFEEGYKAIRLEVFGLPVDVAFPERFDLELQMHGPDQTDRLKKLYEEYPGAVKAARVAKWMFRDLKGMDVEYIVNDVARDGKKIWESRAQDVEGSQLFQAVLLQLAQYPDVTAFSSLSELERKAFTARGKETLENIKWSLTRSQVLAKVLLQMCSSNSLGQDAELLDALCQNASMIEYECLSRDRPNTASAKLDLTWQRDMSISPKDVNLGFSVKIKPDTTTTKDSGDRTSETSVVQRSRNEQGKQDGQSTSSGSFGGTWPEKILLSFDNMLYLMEQEKMVAKTRLEAKYVQGMCMSLEAFLEMATRKKKQERWRSRKMPKSMHEIEASMRELGIETCDQMQEMILKSDMPAAWKGPLIAFLFVWRCAASAWYILPVALETSDEHSPDGGSRNKGSLHLVPTGYCMF